jgi:Carboxypeptidase regulatory-like domain
VRCCSLLLIVSLLKAQDTSATLRGEIRGPQGATVGTLNAELMLLEPPHTVFSVRSDDKGNFRFTVLPPGTYTLTAEHVGFKTLKVKSIPVASTEQKVLPPLRMDLAPTDTPWLPIAEFALRVTDLRFGNLSGRVMRDQSLSVAGAAVRLLCGDKLCSETKTDARGEFIFFNLQPGDDYAIRVSRPGYYPWQGTDYTVLAGYDATYRPIVLPRRPKLSRAASTVR